MRKRAGRKANSPPGIFSGTCRAGCGRDRGSFRQLPVPKRIEHQDSCTCGRTQSEQEATAETLKAPQSDEGNPIASWRLNLYCFGRLALVHVVYFLWQPGFSAQPVCPRPCGPDRSPYPSPCRRRSFRCHLTTQPKWVLSEPLLDIGIVPL